MKKILHEIGFQKLKSVITTICSFCSDHEKRMLKEMLSRNEEFYRSLPTNLPYVEWKTDTIFVAIEQIRLGKAAVLAVVLSDIFKKSFVCEREIEDAFGQEVLDLLIGLRKVDELYEKNPIVESENFRRLLMTFANDLRVILIMIADRLALIRLLNTSDDTDLKVQLAKEASLLYAPLAHRVGLYKVKSELEDIALKYTQREVYSQIARKLNETKQSREEYITSFIHPVEEKLKAAGLNFDIKGRTKTIHSIYHKMRKQNTDIEHIYDLFAIRIILDSPIENEKAQCWHAYSIVTDMYRPNPNRLRDWLSVPKSNGYESLHVTVMGPQGKWVEVQIRSRRMDEVAEMGVAAHWKYKGGASEVALDHWLKGVRDVLEHAEDLSDQPIDEFKMRLYEKEIFIFTPNGELRQFPRGATLLDFAFQIHTSLGAKTVGGKVNGQHVSIKYVLKNGDQVEVITSAQQKPKQDWLHWVALPRTRTKIRQVLKEATQKQSEFGKEALQRRFKNHKTEYDEGILSRLIKQEGYKTMTDFYADIAAEKLDTNVILDKFLAIINKDNWQEEEKSSAESYSSDPLRDQVSNSDVMVIDKGVRGIDFTLAKCCNPIYGDEVFGFVCSMGGIKIHRQDCPNAYQMKERFGYRIVQARWSGKAGSQYIITLKVIGIDDLGIVTNITSLIGKEKDIMLRAISIDSSDGLFHGHLSLLLADVDRLDYIIKKITSVKGVKEVVRLK